jgi:hypothetical protein
MERRMVDDAVIRSLGWAAISAFIALLVAFE